MKKFMMGMFILLFVVAISCVGGVKRAEAVAFGDGGAALQGVFDGITTNPLGNSSVDVVNDALADVNDTLWSIGGSGGALSSIVVEFAAFAGTNKFGIYDAANANNRVQLFDGSAAAGNKVVVGVLATGNIEINLVDTGINFASGNSFGFYLDASVGNADANGIFFSDSSLNVGGLDHLAAYQGVGDTIQVLPSAAGIWGPNEYILAWEDLLVNPDNDFTDFVVLVESVNPVPEPGTIALLGIGLAGLVGVGARRRAKKKAA